MTECDRCPFTCQRGGWRISVWSTSDTVHGLAELQVPHVGPLPMWEPPLPVDRHDMAALEALALALSRGTSGAIHYARALRLVLISAAAGSSSQAAA
jgi:hypothetical protein